MKEFVSEMDELIAKVLTEEASSTDEIKLRSWLEESPDNRQYFEELKNIWTTAADATPALDVDTDRAWATVHKRIHAPKPLKINQLSLSYLWKVAAAVALLITATWWFTREEKVTPLSIVADATARIDTLKDGSVIQMNKKSSIVTTFSKKERRVEMAGEAYFKVAPDKKKPFIIDVKNLEIQVVGTAFKVDNFSQTGKIIVTVEEGVVRLKGMKEEDTLTKGQRAVYDVTSGTFEKEQKTKTSIAKDDIKLGVFDYNGENVKNIVAKMMEYYKTSIVFEPEAESNCSIVLTVNFNDPLENTLDVLLANCDGLDFKKQNGRYIIFKKAN